MGTYSVRCRDSACRHRRVLKRQGVADDDIPLEFLGNPMKETDDVPF